MARLILVKANDVQKAPELPSLAAFAADRGLEEFSEAEQQERFRGVRSGHRRRLAAPNGSSDLLRRIAVRTTASQLGSRRRSQRGSRRPSCPPSGIWSTGSTALAPLVHVERRRLRAEGRADPRLTAPVRAVDRRALAATWRCRKVQLVPSRDKRKGHRSVSRTAGYPPTGFDERRLRRLMGDCCGSETPGGSHGLGMGRRATSPAIAARSSIRVAEIDRLNKQQTWVCWGMSHGGAYAP